MAPAGEMDSGSNVRMRVVSGCRVLFDREDFLLDPDDWNDEVARVLAAESGIEDLDSTQWQVIAFLRKFYYQNGRAPLNKELRCGLGMSLLALKNLFPQGIKRGARRLAGLPNPKSCL